VAKQNLSDILRLLKDLAQAPAHIEPKGDGSLERSMQVNRFASKLRVYTEHDVVFVQQIVHAGLRSVGAISTLLNPF
jgi:hypothetical protein